MSTEIAKWTVDGFLRTARERVRIRIFGGEPLLDFQRTRTILQYTLDAAAMSGREIDLDITTNGTCLDDKIIRFFTEHPSIELILSLDGVRSTQVADRVSVNDVDSFSWVRHHGARLARLPNVTVNKVISPRNVRTLLRDLYFVRRMGFSRINLLPAYFNPWPETAIRLLRDNFGQLPSLLAALRAKAMEVKIKNHSVLNEQPLFGGGVLVDVDGNAYASNMAVCRAALPIKRNLLVGRIPGFDFRSTPPLRALRPLLNRAMSAKILDSTDRVDRALSEFVSSISHSEVPVEDAFQ